MSTRPATRPSRLPYVAASACLLLLLLFFLSPTNFAQRSRSFNVPADSTDSKSTIPESSAQEQAVYSQDDHVSGESAGLEHSEIYDVSQPEVIKPTQEAKPGPNGFWDPNAYIFVESQMTPDKKWFSLDFGDFDAYNANLIVHPWRNDTWYMIAQSKGALDDGEGVEGMAYAMELVCAATYTDGKMRCNPSAISLPIASTVSDNCTGDKALLNFWVGPSDARVFYGPDRPLITYGSGSHNGGCLGQWIHDLRRLVRWSGYGASNPSERFFWPTELKRPPPVAPLEKNWFLFWDAEDEMYVHYDIYPKRTFAKIISDDGNITDDLAPLSAEKDDACIGKYMPKLDDNEYIHQATNSLAVIMCRRDDVACDVQSNTYILTIFHHKEFHELHNLYEPYVMLFKQTAPFDIHSISSKPFFVRGRGRPGESENWPADQSQMMYVTSVSWKDHGTYRGYMDDTLFVNFGIEDRASGAIDVVAEDILREMHQCD